jgi:D-xylose 1-dehydrogenase (NADP+, D-xylono-1,5-lactone-forming)
VSGAFRWGLLGASGIVQDRFLPALAGSETSRPAAVASRDLGRAQAIADAFGIPTAYGSYEQLLADPDVDAVYVSVANTQHVEWIIAALEAGKPVLSEKPMVLDGAEAERVHEASQRAGLPVLEGFMYRFHPQNVHLREAIARGDIGELREVRSHFSFPLVGMMRPDNIRITDGKGAGALMDVGSYVVSSTRMIFGDEPIDARGYIDVSSDLPTDVGFSGSLRYPGDRWATVSWSLRGGYGAGYTAIGSEGSLEVPHGFIPGANMIEETQVVYVAPDGTRTTTAFAPVDHFALMVDAFARAVESGTPMPYGSADALGNARALDLIRATAG